MIEELLLLMLGTGAGLLLGWVLIHWLPARRYPQSLAQILDREQMLIAQAPEAMIVLCPTLEVAAWNPVAEKLYGYSKAEALGKNIVELSPALPGSMKPEDAAVVLRAGRPWHGRFACRDKYGKLLTISSTSTPLYSTNGHVLGFVAIDLNVTEQIQTEEQFMHQATLLSAVQDAMIAVDRQFRIMEWNRAAEQLYGWTSAEALGKLMRVLLRTEPNDAITEGFSSRLRRAGTWQGRMVHFGKAGERVIVSSSISFLYDEDGKPMGYLAVDRDITQQVEIERALEQRNAYLDALNQTAIALLDRLDLDELLGVILSRAGTLVGSPDSYVYLLDETTGEMTFRLGLGITREYMGRRATYGKGLTGTVWATKQILSIEDYSTWPERAADIKPDVFHAILGLPLRSAGRVTGVLCLVQTNPKVQFTSEDKQILERFAELASIALDNAQLFRAGQQELAERARAEKELVSLNAELERRVAERTAELENQQAQLLAVVDAMGEGVIYSENGQIRFTNRAMAEMLDYPVSELLGIPRATLMSEPKALRKLSTVTLGKMSGQTARGQSIVHRRDGSDFEAALTLTHIESSDSPEQSRDVLIVRDVTEEKQLEMQKAKFIANASHELRTPLTNLKTRLYLMHRQPERQDEHLTVIERVTGRMAQLVDDLLDVTRFERGAIHLYRQRVVFQPIVQEVAEMQRPEAQRKRITLATDLQAQPLFIDADADRITQVLVNLIINAINYTMDGGSVFVQLYEHEQCALLSVRDNGIGIAPENLSRIFEPFFRASEGTARGTGLGLNISQEIVRLHGGSIRVESEIGHGSTFIVSLPMVDRG